MSEVHRVAVEIGGTEIAFETGKMAKQASGAVTVTAGDTVVLSTATAGNLRDVDFLPLTVDVEERMYAAGKIPGSFFKREGRAGEKATLIARMIDRPLRPLFPKGWRRETQLVNLTLSVDQVHPYDILAMNGASAALMISDVPYPTAVGAVRIGKIDGNFVVNPTDEQLLTTDMDLVVAGTDEAVLMVECGANEVPEAEILDALDIAHDAIKKLCAAQVELQKKAGKPKQEIEVAKADEAPDRQDRQVARQEAGRGHERHGQARAPVGDQGRRGGSAREVLRQGRRGRLRREAPGRAARVRRAREEHHPPAHRRPQEAPGRPLRARDPRDHGRRQAAAAHARLRAVHARPDAGAERRRARHHARGDAPGQPRSRDVQALLPPLQLPALLRGRGRLHARPQAPRHRPRRARRARAGPDDPGPGDVPVHDPRRVGHPGVQRLVLDGLGLRLQPLPDGRRRAAQAAGRRHRHGPDQGGRRLRHPLRHRRRRGSPRRHGLQGRGHV